MQKGEGALMTILVDILVVAIVANIITDIYEWALERISGKTRDWHLVGRWLANIFTGSFVLDTGDESRAVPGELVLGWTFHYAVGAFYAAAYLYGVQFFFNQPPSAATAIGFGVITVAAPWFILMPGLGVGFFAANAGRPNFVRVASLSVHTVFGVGLYAGVVVAGLMEAR
jgi:hypothetical protein